MRALILIVILIPFACPAAGLQRIITLPDGTTVTALKFDTAGNILIGGYTKPASPKSTLDGSDAFVAKLSGDGSQTLFRTVLAGASTDRINDIAVAPDGSVYATGITSSTDFPATTGSLGASITKGFYTHLDSKGGVVSVTILGGTGDSSGKGIAIDSHGAVYITGGLGTPANGAYVTKIDSAGTVVFTNNATGGDHIALDAQGNIYISGTLLPPNLVPTTPGAFQPTSPLPECANASRDLPCFHQYISKLDPTGKQLLYSTFVAGTREEGPTALAVDAQGNAYLAGSTSSPDYPVTPGAYQPFSLAGPLPKPVVAVPQTTPDPISGFVTKLNPSGSALVFSTYLGGSATDTITSMSLDAAGNIYLAGTANSADFPGFSGVPERCAEGAFVTRLTADGASLSSTQLLYGVAALANSVVAVDPSGKPWLAQSASLAQADLFAAPSRFACATDSADFAILGQVAPGQLISLFGDNLGLGDPASATVPYGSTYPTSLAGVTVTFNGIPAPVLYVSPTQINVQAPFEIAGQSVAHLQLTLPPVSSSAAIETRDFSVIDRAPSVFVLDSGRLECGTVSIGGWHPLALNADGTLNSCGNPAARGSTITLFLQGAGVTSPVQATGATVTQPAVALNLPISNTDGTARLVGASGVAGVISGVWAVQLQIPNGLTTNFTAAGLNLRETTLVIWSK